MLRSEEDKKEVERIAYFKWLDAGKPEGLDKYFWDMAEREFQANKDEIIEINFGKPKVVRLGTGYFYCPYVPLTKEPPAWFCETCKQRGCPGCIAIDPEPFVPRKGIMTKYGKRLLKEGKKYYSKITIQNNEPVDVINVDYEVKP